MQDELPPKIPGNSASASRLSRKSIGPGLVLKVVAALLVFALARLAAIYSNTTPNHEGGEPGVWANKEPATNNSSKEAR